MKKRIRLTVVLSLFGMIGLLAAVGWAAQKEVVYMSDESDPKSIRIFNKVAADFTAKTGIKVKNIFVGFDEFPQRLATLIAAGTPPQMIKQGGGEGVMYYNRGLSIAVTDVCNDLDIQDSIRFKVDGQDVFIPSNIDFSEGWYRSDLFEAKGLGVPKTWNEYLQAAKALSNPPDMYGANIPTSKTLACELIWSFICYSNDIHWKKFKGDGSVEVILDKGDNMKRAIEGLEFALELGRLSPPGATASWGEMMSNFATGRVATSQYCGARLLDKVYTNNRKLYPHTKPMRWPYNAKAKAAGLDVSKVPIWVEGYTIFDTGLNEETKRFAKFFLESAGFAEWCLSVPFHIVPYSMDVWHSESFKSHPRIADRPDVYQFIEDTFTGAWPQAMWDSPGPGIVDPFRNLHENAHLGGEMIARVVVGKENPEKVLKETANEVRRLIKVEQAKIGKKK
jgi:multiple sugar transport system substrate-binding protein